MNDPFSKFEVSIMNAIEKHVDVLNTNMPKHNHAPCRFIVKGCVYCNKHGNVLV